MLKRTTLTALAIGLALAAPALARKPIPPLPTDPPTPGPGVAIAAKATKAWLSRLDVRAPRTYKGMKVFPLTARGDFKLGDLLTLDEALKSKALVVTEMEGGARVNELKLENVGGRPVFIMGGEIMRGAKQDRTLQGDVVIPPKSGPMVVRAFCTEQGRWTEQTASFQAADAAVPNSVRGAAKSEKAQGAVWDSIAENQAKLKVAAPTSAAREVYQNPKVQQDTKPFVDAFLDLPARQRELVGVAVTFGDRLIAVDVFGDDALLAKLYPKLLRAYVVDVVGDAWRGDRGADDVRKLLAGAGGAAWSAGKTDGVGTALEFRTGKLHGTAIVERDAVLHVDMFEGDPPSPQSRERTPQRMAPVPNVAPQDRRRAPRAPNAPNEEQRQEAAPRQEGPRP